MTRKDTSIAVVMPNYNHGEALQSSLKAIVSQTSPPDEIIIVDDGSTDHSVSVIEQFAEEHDNIRLIGNPENRGVQRSVLRGLQASTSEYIILASAV